MARERYQGIIKGGPDAAKALAPDIEATKQQYKIARDAIERNMPKGGQLYGARRDVDIAESGDIGRLFTGKFDEAIARLAQMGVFGTQAGMTAGSGAVSAGDSLARLAAARGAAVAGGIGGIAEAIGMAYGAHAMGQQSGCSRDFKEEIAPYDDFDGALAILRNQPLYTFQYKEHIDPTHKRHIGIITEDSFGSLVTPDGKHMDIVDAIGLLIGAVKAQQAQIVELQKKLILEKNYA